MHKDVILHYESQKSSDRKVITVIKFWKFMVRIVEITSYSTH